MLSAEFASCSPKMLASCLRFGKYLDLESDWGLAKTREVSIRSIRPEP